MKLEKIKKGSYKYKSYCIDYLPERKLWNIATPFSAGWQFHEECKTLRECREWLIRNES